MKTIRLMSLFAGAAVLGGLLWAQQGQEDERLFGSQQETGKLPLKLESGKNFSYQVMMQFKGGPQDLTQREERPLDEPTARAQERPENMNFDIQVLEASGNQNVLQVTVKHQKSATDIGRIGEEDPQRETGQIGQRPKEDKEKEEVFKVTLDQNGKIQQIEKSTAGGSGQEHERESSLGQQHAMGGMDAEKKVRLAIAAIVGSGLHEKELQEGQVYELAADLQQGRSGSTGGMEPLKLRYSGKIGNNARFDVLGATAEGGADRPRGEDRPGRQEEEEDDPFGQQREQDIGRTRAGASAGNATYSMETGLVENFTCRLVPLGGASGQKQESGLGATSGMQPKLESLTITKSGGSRGR